MVVEGHLGPLEPPGRGLADVMQQRRQPAHDVRLVAAGLLQVDGLLQHRQRVRVDVLVTHVLVAFQAQRGQLREEVLGDAGAH